MVKSPLCGVWCVACLVLMTAYSSFLIASLTAPDQYKPIINSVNDLPNKPEIRVTVNKEWFLDVLFKVSWWRNNIKNWLEHELFTIWINWRFLFLIVESCKWQKRGWNFKVSWKRIESSSRRSLFYHWRMRRKSPERVKCLHFCKSLNTVPTQFQ